MRENNVQQKSGIGGKIVAFLLGLIFGMILVLGAIGGGVYFILNGKIDTVLGWAGLDNSADENGNNRYINTNVDEGGAETLKDLFGKLYALTFDFPNMTLGQIDDLVPASRGIFTNLVDSLGKFVEVDYDELAEVKFGEFGSYAQELILDVQPAGFFDTEGMNGIVELILCGTEADTVTVEGVIYPLYRDTEADTYIYCMDENWYVAEEFGGTYTPTNTPYTAYAEDKTEPTGNYYTDGAGDRQYIDPITLRTLMYGDSAALDKVLLVDLLEGGEDDDMLKELFGDLTLGDLVAGDINVRERINELTVPTVTGIDPEQPIMAYLGYGITGVKQNGSTWTAKYKTDEKIYECTLELNGKGNISKVTYVDDGGQTVEVGGTKIKDVNGRIEGLMEDLTVGELMGIDDDSSAILRKIKNSTVSNLPKAIDSLTINELYTESIYGHSQIKQVVESDAGEGQINFNAEYLYYKEVDGVYSLVGGTGKVTSYEAGLYTYGEVTGFWKLLLVEYDGHKGEKAYALNDVVEMAKNLSDNLKTCCLDDLYDAGVITFEEGKEDILKKIIPTTYGKYANRKVGSLTISEAVNFLGAILDGIS